MNLPPGNRKVKVYNSCKSYRKAARQLHMSKSTLYRTLNRNPKPASAKPLGRPSIINERETRLILNHMKKNPFDNPRKILNSLQLNCSLKTIERFLKKHEFEVKKLLKNLLLRIQLN